MKRSPVFLFVVFRVSSSRTYLYTWQEWAGVQQTLEWINSGHNIFQNIPVFYIVVKNLDEFYLCKNEYTNVFQHNLTNLLIISQLDTFDEEKVGGIYGHLLINPGPVLVASCSNTPTHVRKIKNKLLLPFYVSKVPLSLSVPQRGVHRVILHITSKVETLFQFCCNLPFMGMQTFQYY